jgi:hypothetical protein
LTHEEMLRMMQGAQMQQASTAHIPLEKIDEFIDRCCKEKDETLFSLGQALQWKLQQSPMISFPELEVYPQVLQRLQQRLNKGEK